MVWVVNPVNRRRQVAASGTGKKAAANWGIPAVWGVPEKPFTPKYKLSAFCFQRLATRRIGVEGTGGLV
jgi:hypothetical protein